MEFLADLLVSHDSTLELSVMNRMILPAHRAPMLAAKRMRHSNSATAMMTSLASRFARAARGGTTSLTRTRPNTRFSQSVAPITSNVLSPPAQTTRSAAPGSDSLSGIESAV